MAEIAGEAIGGAVVGGTVLRGVSGLRRLAAASSRATAVAAAEAGGVLESEVAGTRLLLESTLEGGEASRMAGAECTGGACPCFVAGTPVETGAGVKPIEEVSLGDRVGSSR